MKQLLGAFSNVIADERILVGDQLSSRYSHIWKMDEGINAMALLMPNSTQEVSDILKICHRFDQSIVIFGGLTNLVGATEVNKNQVVISLEKMNKIEEIDIHSNSMTVQSGVILENIHSTAKDKGMVFPLNFGAKGSAQIGGIVSTNAGGLRVFRYGMCRDLVLGIEAVLADGTIVNSLKKIIKNNSGYDLKQLFIGSEGTLGIVTRVSLKLINQASSRTSAFVGIDDYDSLLEFLRFMKKGSAGTLSGFELIWKETYKVLTSPPALVGAPLPYDYKYYVLLEQLGADQQKDQERLEGLLEEAMENGLIQDAAIAFNQTELDWFWRIREDVHVLSSQANHDQHFDISMPVSLIGQKIEEITQKLHDLDFVEKVFRFGHVADGNIHFIIGKSEQSDEIKHQINQIVYAPLKEIGGSVSAEHGIGIDKKAYLNVSRNEEEIQLMKTMKIALDPKNILNPGRIFDL